jgi:hypothetical protein
MIPHVRAYFAATPPKARAALKKIRAAIRAKPIPVGLVKKLVRARIAELALNHKEQPWDCLP